MWGYFRFVDITAPSRIRGPGEIAFFVLSFAVLGVVGVRIGRRWRQPLADWARSRAGADEARVRRLALTFPYAMAALSLAGWTLAGVAWGVVWPLLVGEFSVRQAIRSIIAISVVAGSVAAAFVFFSVESLWRRRVPVYFPRGDLSATTGVPRMRVRTRLMVIFLLVGVLPLTVLGVLAYTRASTLIGTDAVTGAERLEGLLLFILFMLVVGGLVAVGLSIFVSRSVAGPLREVETAMRGVERGNLQVQCPVVSNDEIGAVAEGFNRMVEGLRERDLIRETFGKYVTQEVRDEILSGRVDLEGADARGDHPLRRHPRFHAVGGGSRSPRGRARPQRVLHAHGGRHPRARRSGPPVHRGRDRGRLRRARLEPAPSRARPARGPGDAPAPGRLERRAGARRAARAPTRDRDPHRTRAGREHRQSGPALLGPGGRSGERGRAAPGAEQGLRLGDLVVGGNGPAARGAIGPRAAACRDGEREGDGGGGLPRRPEWSRRQRVAARATAWTNGAAFGFETSPRIRMSVTEISRP